MSLNPASDLIDLINSSTAASGGTSEGMSRDKTARECGLKVAFYAAADRPRTVYPEMILDAKGKPFVVGTRAGTAYHALREITANGQALPTVRAEDFKDIDPAIEAALGAFRRADPRVFGTTLGVEVAVEGVVSGVRRTGRIDRVVQADLEAVDRWADYGQLSAEPGLYLWDYKLYKAVTHKLREKHERDLQALLYMRLFEQRTGTRPKGFIYDLTSRAANPTEARLLALVPNSPDADGILDYYIAEAEESRLAGKSNAGACDSQFGACPFIKYCPRKGDKNTNKDIIENYRQLHLVIDEDDEQ